MNPKYPWLVVQNLDVDDDDKGDQIFYPIHDPLSRYQLQIPELLGRRIRGCFHGWVILSNHPLNHMWSIWNPMTTKVIHLPPLIEDFEPILECCLSFPPEDPRSLLLLIGYGKSTIVLCRLDRLQWTETSYAQQLRCVMGNLPGDDFLCYLTCCNGKVYAMSSWTLVHVSIVVKDEEVVIDILPFPVEPPFPNYHRYNSFLNPFIKGSCAELFYILLAFDEVAKKQVGGVCVYKLDMTSMIWEELEDLKDAIFFMDLAHDYSIFYLPEVAPELGGYIHVLDENGQAMHSLHVKDKSVSLSSMPCLASSSSLSLWECRLPGDLGEVMFRVDSKPAEGNYDDIMMVDINSMENEDNNESCLLNIPFNVLEMIMELCVGVEYLHFRATCKTSQLGAPIIRWSKGTMLNTLQTPWLVVLDDHQGLITFVDPVFGDKYFIKTPRELNGADLRIHSSRYGWLLMLIRLRNPVDIANPRLVFFNPFTRDILELPRPPCSNMFCFSAPPTSPDCMVVGFGKLPKYWPVYVHFVGRGRQWHLIFGDMYGAHLHYHRFPTFHGSDLYALCNDDELAIKKDIHDVDANSWWEVVAKAPRSSCGSAAQYFLVNGDKFLLLVKLGEFGDCVEVFKLNTFTKEWEKIDDLGRSVIYICDTTCIYMEAKTQDMENTICFPRLHSQNGKIVFYSLKTGTYHTSNGENSEENFFGTKHYTCTHTWIEPSWS